MNSTQANHRYPLTTKFLFTLRNRVNLPCQGSRCNNRTGNHCNKRTVILCHNLHMDILCNSTQCTWVLAYFHLTNLLAVKCG